MLRFSLISISFGFLFAVFYEMSGGDEFDAETLRLSRIEAPAPASTGTQSQSRLAAIDAADGEVSRVALNLTSLGEVMTPQRTLPTTPARQIAAQPAADAQGAQIFVASASAATQPVNAPSIVLPSLIPGAVPEPEDTGVTITPVDLSAPQTQELGTDIRSVTGSRVNVRGGPGTNFSVVNSLSRGDEVVVIDDPGEGWVMLRPVGGGPIGWMADFLLTNAS